MQASNKLKVTLVLPHPLFGRDSGSIRTLELLEYLPDNVELTILEKVFDHKIKEENVVKFRNLNKKHNIKLISINSMDHNIAINSTGKAYSPVVLWLIVPLIIKLEGFIFRKQLKFLNNQDVIYLFDNRDVELIPHGCKAKIVGTNHGFVYERIPRSKFKELIVKSMGKMTLMGLIFHRIKYWHLFPGITDKVGYIPRNNIIIPIGIKFNEYFSRKGSSDVKFLFAGQLKEGKGIKTVLDAWNKGHIYNYGTLTICGWGPLGDELSKNPYKNVIFKGFVSDNNLRDLFGQSDIFVYPTKGDNFGFVILEALASGMHVLTTDIMSGLFDEFHEIGALEYINDDVPSFEERMRISAENIIKIRAQSIEVRKIVEQYYGLDTVSNKLYNYFREISEEGIK